MVSFTTKYVEDQYIDKLINYKYRGGDDSILCRFVIDPFCCFIVNYFPKWLAPNVITVSGWFLNLFNLILTTYYTGWKGGEPVPLWACITVAFCYTTYIILDYTDGKQARRLKASSPLGLLIDHGTDACTTFYVTIIGGTLCYYNNIYQYLFYYIPISFTFFMNTWEEYYKGELILPIVHGVAEGTLYIDIMSILSGIYGSSLYCKQVTLFNKYTFTIGELNGLFTLIAGSLFSIKSVFGVLSSIKKEKRLIAFKDTLIYFLFAITILSVSFLTDSIIVKEYPKIVILTFGFLFAKILGILQLSHILECPFRVYKPVFLIPLLALLIHSLTFYFTGYTLLVSTDALIIAAFIWNVLSWAHYVYFCSDEICEILNINRFILGKRYPSRKSYEEIKNSKFA
jgi:phosphatidylglycerophosphate synthase